MHAIENAFIYCYHTIGEIFYRPRLLLMLFFFLIENILAAGLALASTTLIIHYFDLNSYCLFAIGIVMASFLFVVYFLYQLLKARTIASHKVAIDQNGQRLKFPALASLVLGYTFQHLVPWRGAGRLGWQNGKHLILPLMVKHRLPYRLAYRRLQDIKSSRSLRFDPHRVAVKPLTFVFCFLAILLAIVLGTWLGFTTASGIVVTFIRRVQATGLALLVFLGISWLPLALSAVKIGFYQADILAVELADQPDYLPELLGSVYRRSY